MYAHEGTFQDTHTIPNIHSYPNGDFSHNNAVTDS